MKLYFAGAETSKNLSFLKEVQVKNVLVSFFYLNKKKVKDYLEFDIFLDSGGYSVRVSKKKIDLDVYLENYIEFIKKWKIKNYANLDMGTYEGTIKNQKTMEKSGLKPIPVYHYSEFSNPEQKEVLIDYCKKYDYVAVGGTAGTVFGRNRIMSYLNYIFKVAKQYNTKIHGFGLTDFTLLSIFPFYSVDSTSWLAGVKYGIFYHYQNGKMCYWAKDRFHKVIGKSFNSLPGSKIGIWSAHQWNQYARFLEDGIWKPSIRKYQ